MKNKKNEKINNIKTGDRRRRRLKAKEQKFTF